jgi:hypothetical protein
MRLRDTARTMSQENAETAKASVRGGRIFGVEYFWDHAEALGTMGLSG